MLISHPILPEIHISKHILLAITAMAAILGEREQGEQGGIL
jgi:hypothetical protein